MVTLASLLQKLTVLVTSFVDLINSLTTSSLTCILFSCNVLVVPLSKSPFLSSVIFYLKYQFYWKRIISYCHKTL